MSTVHALNCDLGEDCTCGATERPRQRASRARAFDPGDVRTWQEGDIQTMLKQRLALGSWVAWHVRKQGHAGRWRQHEGIIEAVPPRAGYGVLDWCCVPMRGSWLGPEAYDPCREQPENIVWVELKSERGKLTDEQAEHALRLARAGQEVAVLRPRHFDSPRGAGSDLAFVRFVLHKSALVREGRHQAWCETLVQPDWDVRRVLAL